MIDWGAATCEGIAPAAQLLPLLERAFADNPSNPALYMRLAALHLDANRFAAAAVPLERALTLDPALGLARRQLARCYNHLERFSSAFDLLATQGEPSNERAIALIGLGRDEEAESELRDVLESRPDDHQATWRLFKVLRATGRVGEVLTMCERLSSRGVGHSQLFYDWGRALALNGNIERARALLFDRARVTAHDIALPSDFDEIAGFNDALADDLLTHPAVLSTFPADEANRGSSRVHNLLAGRRPDLIRALLHSIEDLVDRHLTSMHRVGAFDPWFEARPTRAHLRAWGLIQAGGAYEDWHLHRGGWLSGVYYIRVPGCVTHEGVGPGCIEFGPPVKLAAQFPCLAPRWRHAPREGTLLLAPSHFSHRTVPTGANDHRISFAFDVVPEPPTPPATPDWA